MPSFLSTEHIQMLRDELTRVKDSAAPLQLDELRTMCDAWDNNDGIAFKAAWKRLHLGYGVRISIAPDQIPDDFVAPPAFDSKEEPAAQSMNDRRPLNDLLSRLDLKPNITQPASQSK